MAQMLVTGIENAITTEIIRGEMGSERAIVRGPDGWKEDSADRTRYVNGVVHPETLR